MGQRDALSYYDIVKIERMYGCDRKQTGQPATVATNNNNYTPGRFQFGRQLINAYTSPQFWQRLFNIWFSQRQQPQPPPPQHQPIHDNYGYLNGFWYWNLDSHLQLNVRWFDFFLNTSRGMCVIYIDKIVLVSTHYL